MVFGFSVFSCRKILNTRHRRRYFQRFWSIFLNVELHPKRESSKSCFCTQECIHFLSTVLSQRRSTQIETNLVIVILMLCVLTYVVLYELFWNWICVAWFVSDEVWSLFDKGFVVWHFLHYCLVQIVSLQSLSIGVRIICTTNKLVTRNRVRDLKSDVLKNDLKKKSEEKIPQTRFCYETKCEVDKTHPTKCAAG